MFQTLKGKLIALLVVIFILSFLIVKFSASPSPNLAPEIVKSEIKKEARNIANPFLVISTTKGDIGIELFSEAAPKTTKKFMSLAQENFYDNKRFFSVIKDNYLMVGDLPGQETTDFTLPLETSPYYNHRYKGVIGLFHPIGKPNAGTNQFYITLGPQPARDEAYTIFGQVRAGLDVLDRISLEDRITDIQILQK